MRTIILAPSEFVFISCHEAKAPPSSTKTVQSRRPYGVAPHNMVPIFERFTHISVPSCSLDHIRRLIVT